MYYSESIARPVLRGPLLAKPMIGTKLPHAAATLGCDDLPPRNNRSVLSNLGETLALQIFGACLSLSLKSCCTTQEGHTYVYVCNHGAEGLSCGTANERLAITCSIAYNPTHCFYKLLLIIVSPPQEKSGRTRTHTKHEESPWHKTTRT